MEVYLIRHTTPLIEKGICYGQTDLALTDSFEDELKKMKGALPSSFDTVYSSPLKRCQMLASKLTSDPIRMDDRLKEIDFGDWEMQAWDDIPQSDLDSWMNDFVNVAPPNGESMLDLQRRVLYWWSDLKQSTHGKIAVVTHGGVIRTLHAHFNHIPLEKSFEGFKISYGEFFLHNTIKRNEK